MDEQVGEKERVLKSSTAKIAQVDENLLQIEEELAVLCSERKQKEKDNDDQTTKRERYDGHYVHMLLGTLPDLAIILQLTIRIE